MVWVHVYPSTQDLFNAAIVASSSCSHSSQQTAFSLDGYLLIARLAKQQLAALHTFGEPPIMEYTSLIHPVGVHSDTLCNTKSVTICLPVDGCHSK
jgi:carboxylesterase type B